MRAGSAASPSPTPAGSPGRGDLRTGRRVAVVAALAAVLVAYVAQAALPATPFDLPGPRPETVRMFLPEGWAFFTKSPRSEFPQVYQRRADGQWHDLTGGPLATPSGLMGLDRLNRSQGTEVALLLAQLPREAWQPCEQEPVGCLNAAPVRHYLANTSTHRSACGEIGLVVQEVLPWAWRDAPTVMPSMVVRVRVSC